MDLIRRIRNARTQLRAQNVMPIDEYRFLCFLSQEDLNWCEHESKQWQDVKLTLPDGIVPVIGTAGCKLIPGPACLEGYVIGKQFQDGLGGLDTIVGIKLLPNDAEDR